MGRKLLFIIAICILAGSYFGYRYAITAQSPTPSLQGIHTKAIISSVSPTPGIPRSISIPKLQVHAAVESVAKDSAGRMDIPKNFIDTAWYELGPRPGELGNAVIDGHVDTPTGAPSVFWNLKKLLPGDQIIITDSNGNSYTFAVTHVHTYPIAQIPLQAIFNPNSPASHLNLITCGGIWDASAHNYSDRTIVYSDLVTNRKKQ